MANTQRKSLIFRRAVSMGAMALTSLALTLPTTASAQDPQSRGGSWQGRSTNAPSSMNRGERMQQSPQRVQPRAMPTRQHQSQSTSYRSERRAGFEGQRPPTNTAPNVARPDQRGWSSGQREPLHRSEVGQRPPMQTPGRPSPNRPEQNRSWQDRQNTYRPQQERRWNEARPDRGTWQTQQRPAFGREAWRNNGHAANRAWDRGWRNDNRYNWSSYRTSNRGIFAGSRYNSPYRGYSYQRIGIGFSLGSLFYRSQYWIHNPYQYRLPDAYGPYRWVRYYDDVLLVDTYSGEVVDAIHDFFY